jgi:hypothetical protein
LVVAHYPFFKYPEQQRNKTKATVLVPLVVLNSDMHLHVRNSNHNP